MRMRDQMMSLGTVVLMVTGSAWAVKVEPIPLDQRKAVVKLPGMCSIKPGGRWDSGIVTGNGIMGASILGHPYEEKVILNHERLFRPFLDARPLPPVISQAVPEVRRLIKEGKSGEALGHWRKVMSENGHPEIVNTPPYHPAYTMHIEREDAGDVTDYLRTVDFMTGEAVVRYRNRDGRWISKTFVSRADNVIVQLFESVDGKPVTLKLSLVDQWMGLQEGHARISVECSNEWVTARCKYKFTKRGYEGTTRVICQGGDLKKDSGALWCGGARRVLLLTRITDLDDFAQSELGAVREDLSALPADYNRLLDAHLKLHRPAMGRMTINLDSSDARYLSSEELIATQTDPSTRRILPALLQKMFHMGRYALLSSSGECPPPLTGIWNGSHKPAWSGDWTLDTNINQQIAGANICALPEALDAYLGLIEEIAPTWEVNAKNIYGCRGYMSGARTAGRENYHTHFGKWPGHCWTAGAAWLVAPLYESYLVTGDKKFLRTRVLPLLEKTVLFYEDFLTEHDESGKFMFIPSYSPEQLPGQSINAVQNIAAGKEAIRNLIAAYEELGINGDRVTRLRGMLEKFPPYLVNEEGVFQEWAFPGCQEGYNHRHMSHSYPVWPAHELSWEEDAALMTAMRVALERRLPQDWSGHNFAVRAFCAARTKYPQLFHQNLFSLMRFDFIQPNLVTRHNPGWCPNTDVLCGLPGMISEALVYSRPGVIELLPAWSPELPGGSIEGIRTRTRATVDSLTWDLKENQVSATITSREDQWITLFARQGIRAIETDSETRSAGRDKISRKVFLKSGQPVRVTIELENAINNYPVHTPAFTWEAAREGHAKRLAEKEAGKKGRK